MKPIKVYISVPAAQPETERVALTEFLSRIGRILYRDYGIRIEAELAERTAPGAGGAREMLQAMRQSDLAAILFGPSVSKAEAREYEAVLARVREPGAKRLLVRTLIRTPAGERAEAVLRKWAQALAFKYGQRPAFYSGIGTVMLQLLLSLRLLEPAFAELSAENGICLLNGREALSLNDVAELDEVGQSDEIPPQFALDLLQILTQREDYGRAISLAERLLDREDVAADPKTHAQMLYLTAVLLGEIEMFDAAEPMFLQALDIFRSLAGEDPDIYLPEVADCCEMLALHYGFYNRLKEAEALLSEGLEIFRSLAAKDPETFSPGLAEACGSLALVCKELGDRTRAEALYRESLERFRLLAQVAPERFLPHLAGTCDELACLITDTGRRKEEEALYLEALELWRRLSAEDPDRYVADIARACFHLGVVYSGTDRPQAADAMFAEALETAKQKPKDPYCADIIKSLADRRTKQKGDPV
jgi:tetratricopeptide (TPR) repeat protein